MISDQIALHPVELSLLNFMVIFLSLFLLDTWQKDKNYWEDLQAVVSLTKASL